MRVTTDSFGHDTTLNVDEIREKSTEDNLTFDELDHESEDVSQPSLAALWAMMMHHGTPVEARTAKRLRVGVPLK